MSKAIPWDFAVFLVVVALTLFLFSPGFLTADSRWQYEQALSGSFSDWHPPLMSWIWSRLLPLQTGQFPIFFFHVIMFWAGVVLIERRLSSRPQRWLAILFVTLWPPVLFILDMVWKDVGMASAFLCAFGLLGEAQTRRSRTLLYSALAPAFYAVSLRHNAVFGLPFFALWWARALPMKPRWHPIVAVAVCFFLLVMSGRVSRLITNNESQFPFQMIALHDLAGLSLKSGEMLLPSYVNEGTPFTLDDLQKIYADDFIDDSWSGPVPPRRLPRTGNAQAASDLKKAWMAAIAQHPLLYLEQRLQIFWTQHGIGGSQRTYNTIRFGIPLSYTDRHPELAAEPRLGIRISRTIYDSIAVPIADTPLFRPLPYLIAGIVMLLRSWRRRDEYQTMLLASALGYAASFLFASPDRDLRYFWYTLAVVVLALAAAVANACVALFKSSRPVDTAADKRISARTCKMTNT